MIARLVAKDLTVLRRSPALLALIVIYPLLVAVGLGLALTREPEPPKVAIVNLLEQGDRTRVDVGGAVISIADIERSLAGGDVQSINLASRERAERMIEAGTIDGALVIPEDAADRLAATLTTGGISQGPELEVLYRSNGPLDGALVRSVVASRLQQAERALSGEIVRVASGFLRIINDGGSFTVLGRDLRILGLRAAQVLVDDAARRLPPAQRGGLQEVSRFARLARENLALSGEILKAIAQPLLVKETAVGATDEDRTLSGFAVGIAAALSLMLVAMTLGAGLLASEREEGTLRRLLRGGRGGLPVAVAKTLAAGTVAAGSGVLLMLGLAALGAAPWSSAVWWLPALVPAALAFAALGVLLGAGLRDARAATLAAILLAVPVAVAALLPAASVGSTAAGILDAASVVVPFDAARSVLDAAVAVEADAGATARLFAQVVAYTGLGALLVRRARS